MNIYKILALTLIKLNGYIMKIILLKKILFWR